MHYDHGQTSRTCVCSRHHLLSEVDSCGSFLMHLVSSTCLHMVHCVFGGLPRVIKQHDACCVQPIRAFLYIVHDSQNYGSDCIIAWVWQQTTPATCCVITQPVQQTNHWSVLRTSPCGSLAQLCALSGQKLCNTSSECIWMCKQEIVKNSCSRMDCTSS